MLEDRFDTLGTIAQLTRSEHLLVWAMRAIALGHEDCPSVVRTFRQVCGGRCDQVLQAYTVFVKYLSMVSPRRLRVHVPGCLCVGLDEAAALTLIAAGQHSLRARSEAGLRRALAETTGGRLDESLIMIVQGVAGLLDSCGLALSERPVRGAMHQPETTPPRRLH